MQIVQSIGRTLMQLQRAGNTHYFGWSVRFSCKTVTQVVLNKWLSRLGDELDDWNEQVKQARRRYYHLNNFTNKQLCAIRRSLCKARFASASPQTDMNPRILAMLQSIAAEVSSEQIWRSTHIALEVIPNPRGSGFAVVASSTTTVLKGPQKDTSEECLQSEANKIEGMLNEEQQKVFQSLTREWGFSEDVAHKAVKHCGASLSDAYQYCRKELTDISGSISEGELSLDNFSCLSDDVGLEMTYDKARAQLKEKLHKIPSVSPDQGFSIDQRAIYDSLTKQYHFADDIAREAVQKHGDSESDAYAYCRQKVMGYQCGDEVSLGGFSVQSEESSLAMSYHTTRENLGRKPDVMVSHSTTEPCLSSASVEHTSLDLSHADDGVV